MSGRCNGDGDRVYAVDTYGDYSLHDGNVYDDTYGEHGDDDDVVVVKSDADDDDDDDDRR